MLTLTGKCTSSMSALVFLEGLIDILPDSIKTETFLDEYESALNRVRHEMSKNMGIKPKALRAKYTYLGTFYSCGNCGAALSITHEYCNKCGRLIHWDSPKCLTK